MVTAFMRDACLYPPVPYRQSPLGIIVANVDLAMGRDNPDLRL